MFFPCFSLFLFLFFFFGRGLRESCLSTPSSRIDGYAHYSSGKYIFKLYCWDVVKCDQGIELHGDDDLTMLHHIFAVLSM